MFPGKGIARTVQIVDSRDDVDPLPSWQDKRLIILRPKAQETIKRMLSSDFLPIELENPVHQDAILFHSLNGSMCDTVIDVCKSLSVNESVRITCIAIAPIGHGSGPNSIPISLSNLETLSDYSHLTLIFDNEVLLSEFKYFAHVNAKIASLLVHLLKDEKTVSQMHATMKFPIGVCQVSLSALTIPSTAEYGLISTTCNKPLSTKGKFSPWFTRTDHMMVIGGLNLKYF
jgi:hypothetical protein